MTIVRLFMILVRMMSVVLIVVSSMVLLQVSALLVPSVLFEMLLV